MMRRDRIEELLQVLDLATTLRGVLRERVRALAGLTAEQAVVLSQVERAGGRVTVSQLAGELGRAPHTVSELVNRMQFRGLVTRQRRANPDRRKVAIELTPLGLDRLTAYRARTE